MNKIVDNPLYDLHVDGGEVGCTNFKNVCNCPIHNNEENKERNVKEYKDREEILLSLTYEGANKIDQFPIWLGSHVPATDKKWLDDHCINYILDIGSFNSNIFPHIKYKKIFIDDDVNAHISLYFEECIDFIDESLKKGSGILVHCYAGISRSATIILAWMIRRYFRKKLEDKQKSDFDYVCVSDFSCCLEDFIDHLRKIRIVINPNAGFISQLRIFFMSEQMKAIFLNK